MNALARWIGAHLAGAVGFGAAILVGLSESLS